VDLWVATGSANESPSEEGISHFLEHLFFKGTPARPVGVMDRQIKTLGGYNNAATSYDFTHYYVVLPSEHVDLAIEILIDALVNMQLPAEEIDRERMVILEEIARKEDSPLGKLYDEFLSRAFARTAYQHSILGTPQSLEKIKRDDFMEYRNRTYAPGNIHVVVSGDVDPEAIRRKVADQTGFLEPSKPVLNKPASTGESLEREFEIFKDVQQTYLCMGIRTPSIQGTPEEVALELAAAVLADGRSSRLVYQLVEKTGLCSSLSTFAWTLGEIGLFGLEACYDSADEHEILKVINEEMSRILDEDIPEDELTKARTILLTGYQYDLEKTSSMANVLGRCSAAGQLDSIVHYEDRIRTLTSKEIRQALTQCCPYTEKVTGFVRPERRS